MVIGAAWQYILVLGFFCQEIRQIEVSSLLPR